VEEPNAIDGTVDRQRNTVKQHKTRNAGVSYWAKQLSSSAGARSELGAEGQRGEGVSTDREAGEAAARET